MSAILVTGGAGYVGSHACRALAAAGYKPVALDNLSTGHRWAVGWGPLEQGDIADHQLLDRVFEAYRPIAVMHFAALSQIGESVRQPERYWSNNVVGTFHLLQAMLRHNTRRIVFSSTCSVYGMPDRIPIVENAPTLPINPYGRTKLAVEGMLKDLAATGGLRAVSLRYFNAAGAEPEWGIGEAHAPETHLIPLAIEAALGTDRQLQVYGIDYPTPDGTCLRDYIHVADLADAHVKALALLERREGFHEVNLGTGRAHSVLEVITEVEKQAESAVTRILCPRRQGDAAVLLADASKANRELIWRPTHSSLAHIIASALQWHRSASKPVAQSTR